MKWNYTCVIGQIYQAKDWVHIFDCLRFLGLVYVMPIVLKFIPMSSIFIVSFPFDRAC
ncbi:unnamed protein product [Linum tenue]|uniref:Uncharacterized protein n=1 Tax=Linum tenue TaxID=586396 RepID=A0AAV0L8D7_9ROSI|nr:unnamed protein product [Linum tenue]